MPSSLIHRYKNSNMKNIIMLLITVGSIAFVWTYPTYGPEGYQCQILADGQIKYDTVSVEAYRNFTTLSTYGELKYDGKDLCDKTHPNAVYARLLDYKTIPVYGDLTYGDGFGYTILILIFMCVMYALSDKDNDSGIYEYL